MLVAYRLAGLSALETRYSGLNRRPVCFPVLATSRSDARKAMVAHRRTRVISRG